MIERIRILGYRKFRDVTVEPHARINVIVGDNESGKSTLLEALGLALTGRINGRPAAEELNPFWFNRAMTSEFFAQRAQGKPVSLPVITIEVFLKDLDEFQRNLYGAHNSATPTQECAGISLSVAPDDDYRAEIEAHIASGTALLPVEYYKVEWRSFGDKILTARPKELTTAVIDSRTIRSTSGVDFHLRQILSDHLEVDEKASISLAFRAVKEKMTSDHLGAVNDKMGKLGGSLDNQLLSLAMDQSARGSWDSNVVPQVDDVPFAMAGQGQQAAVKIALALSHRASGARVVMIEEPENHLSHTSLNKLMHRVSTLAGDEQQLFITTHSSFVLNRLGMDGLMFVSDGRITSTSSISESTVKYFKKLPGYDTLRMLLAERFVLVEGPSDEIIFERFYLDLKGKRPIEDGIDVVSMRGLSLARCLELASVLDKKCAALTDNDGKEYAAITKGLGAFLDNDKRRVFVGDITGRTLEPQILAANPDEATMREVLSVTEAADPLTWMTNNKTEASLRIAESDTTLEPPSYFKEAIEFI